MLLLIAALLGTLSNATSFNILPFSEFTESSSNIVHGTLHSIRTEGGVSSDGGKTIYTYAELDVLEVIKGSIRANSTITIRKLGGTKDGVTLEIPGSVEFDENEDAVLFLDPIPDAQMFEVTGMEQGKFGLKEENGEKVLTGGIFTLSEPGVPTVDPNKPNKTDEHAENKRPWTLKQLQSLVMEQTKGNPTPPPSPTVTPNSANLLTSLFLKSNKPNEPSSSTTATKQSDSSSLYKTLMLLVAAILILVWFSRRNKKSK